MAKENSNSNNSNNTRVTRSPSRNTISPPARAKTPISAMINSAFNSFRLVVRSPERTKKQIRRKVANSINSREISRIVNAAKAAQNLNKKKKEAIRTSLNAIKKAKEAQKKAKNKNAGKK